MKLLLICLVLLHAAGLNEVAANVFLNSDIESERQFACDGELVTFTCEVFGSLSLQWRNSLVNPISFSSGDTAPIIRLVQPFLATLTSRVGTGINANFTSTLQVNASRNFSQSDTTVECRNQQQVSDTANFTAAAEPRMPQELLLEFDSSAMLLNVTWMSPDNVEQFDLDNYTVVLTSTSGLSETRNVLNTTQQFPVLEAEGVTFMVEITATDMCGVTSGVVSRQLVVPNTTTPPSQMTPDSGCTLGCIIGIVVGVLVLVAVIVIIAIAIGIYIYKHKQ